MICSCACWNDGLDAFRAPVALGSGAADADCLSFEDVAGAGVSACTSAAVRRGRSVAGTGVGVAAARGVDATRGGGFAGVIFSSPGTGVATAT